MWPILDTWTSAACACEMKGMACDHPPPSNCWCACREQWLIDMEVKREGTLRESAAPSPVSTKPFRNPIPPCTPRKKILLNIILLTHGFTKSASFLFFHAQGKPSVHLGDLCGFQMLLEFKFSITGVVFYHTKNRHSVYFCTYIF